jgi:hypothetical protein
LHEDYRSGHLDFSLVNTTIKYIVAKKDRDEVIMEWARQFFRIRSGAQISKYKKSVLKYYCARGRKDYEKTGPNNDEIRDGIDYFIRVSDRIGDKARSIISYNAIILAFYVVFRVSIHDILLILGISLALFSCFVLFPMLFVAWGNPESITSMEKALDTVADRSIKRARMIIVSCIFTGLSMLILILAMLAIYSETYRNAVQP